jgi:hypothetical protein
VRRGALTSQRRGIGDRQRAGDGLVGKLKE